MGNPLSKPWGGWGGGGGGSGTPLEFAKLNIADITGNEKISYFSYLCIGPPPLEKFSGSATVMYYEYLLNFAFCEIILTCPFRIYDFLKFLNDFIYMSMYFSNIRNSKN